MADKNTVNKVKELLETNAYAPLKEAAEKWLAAADEKYGDRIDELREKAAPAMDKLGDAAEEYSDFSVEAGEKLKGMSEKISDGADKLADKAGPAFDQLKDKAAPALDKISDSEFVAKLKESVSTFRENIDFFSSDEAKDKFGEEAAEQIRKHAEEMRAQGKTYCDCPACTKAREILRDLGVDLEAESAE